MKQTKEEDERSKGQYLNKKHEKDMMNVLFD